MRGLRLLIGLLLLSMAAPARSADMPPPHGAALFGYLAELRDIVVLERVPEDERKATEEAGPWRICGEQRLRPVLGPFVDHAIQRGLPRDRPLDFVDCEDFAAESADMLMIAAHPKSLKPAEIDALLAGMRAGTLRKRAHVSYGAYMAGELAQHDGRPTPLPDSRYGMLISMNGGDALCVQPGAESSVADAAAALPLEAARLRQRVVGMSAAQYAQAGADGRCGAIIADMASLSQVASALHGAIPAELRDKLIAMLAQGIAGGQAAQVADMIASVLAGADPQQAINMLRAMPMPIISINTGAPKPAAGQPEQPPLRFLTGPISSIPLEIVALAVLALLYVGVFYVFGAPTVIDTFNGYADYHGESPVVPAALRHIWTATTVIALFATFLCGASYAMGHGGPPDPAVKMFTQATYLVAFTATLLALAAERMAVGSIVHFLDRQLGREERGRVPVAIKALTVLVGLAFLATYLNLVVDSRGAALERI